MKDGVVIINMARDLLVNDDDMAEALMSGKVKRYVTDFPNEKVMHMKNVIANLLTFPLMRASAMSSSLTRRSLAMLMMTTPSFIFSAAGINIANMTNKSKGRFAYTMMDLDTDVPDVLLQRVRAINGVCRVRVIK